MSDVVVTNTFDAVEPPRPGLPSTGADSGELPALIPLLLIGAAAVAHGRRHTARR
ncbi:LPXTG cell wall anchor domain-containing protein [Tessaracoccus defluvii]|uniref:LPXTG cell wall anchor domain-containing protein n=1 Tax=Tessaracoccus defluvii TaxID=1285901 RepID=A0A7H0H5X9_9ACTN|nr:LPXTG cell wall anchor domain-containing protein [Tessaracoccus defluvii]QNP55945.1 LPXTG cell wall anchor domain-containing protein [Tessaracoccus defluvii]